jgi:hypothetical protein
VSGGVDDAVKVWDNDLVLLKSLALPMSSVVRSIAIDTHQTKVRACGCVFDDPCPVWRLVPGGFEHAIGGAQLSV